MAKQRAAAPLITKKHLARAQKERIQIRWIMVGALLTAVLVIGFLGYGWFDLRYIRPKTAVATVNDEKITLNEFQGRARQVQLDLLSQISTGQQFMTMFADDPTTLASLQQQVEQLQAQLQDSSYVGQTALDALIGEVLVRQWARELGVVVEPWQVDNEIANQFGYYPEGTPTPAPTATMDPTEAAQVEPSATPTVGPSPTWAPSSTPSPTATPYTEEAYRANLAAYLERIASLGISEKDFRAAIEGPLYYGAVLEAVRKGLPQDQEQLWLRHILVADEATAQRVFIRLAEREAWPALAAELSLDEATKENGGDLGWLTEVELLLDYGEQFKTQVLEAKKGQLVGPVQTSSGWHVVEVLDRAVRPASDSVLQRIARYDFQESMLDRRLNAIIETSDIWRQHVPPAPTAVGGA